MGLNKSVLIDAGVDYDGAVQRCVGDASLYERVLRCFIDDGERMNRMADAAARQDYEALLRVVHDLKGTSGNLGLQRVYHRAADITAMLRAESHTQLDEQLGLLAAEHEATVHAIKQALI